MPVDVKRLDLGPAPTRVIKRGPLAGQLAPAYEVILPGWNDIIRVESSAALSAAEAAVERQRRTASLNRSPSPEVVRNFAKIGQAVDDVQDGLVTLSVAGRIASKLIGRAIPGIGLISSAADVVNMLNVFYPKSAGQAAVGAVTRAGAKISGRKKYLASKEVKRSLGLAPDASLSTYLRRLDETLKTGKVNVGLGELLQVGQTAQQLTGYGIALGPIFGGLQDTFFGLIRGARFDLTGGISIAEKGLEVFERAVLHREPQVSDALKRARAVELARQQGLPAPKDPRDVARILADNPLRIQVDFPGIIPAVDILRGAKPGTTEADLKPYLDPLADVVNKGAVASLKAISAAKQATVAAAVKVYSGLQWLVGVRGDLTWEDHIELLCAQILAQQELAPLVEAIDLSIVVAGGAARPVELLPFCGGDHEHSRDPGSVANCLARGPGRVGLDWVDEAPSSDARDFTVALVDVAASQALSMFEGSSSRVFEDNGPSWKALWLLHEYDFLPPYDRSDQETMSFIQVVIDAQKCAPCGLPAFDLVERLYLLSFPGVESD